MTGEIAGNEANRQTGERRSSQREIVMHGGTVRERNPKVKAGEANLWA